MTKSGKACRTFRSRRTDRSCSTRSVVARMDRTDDFAYDAIVPPDVIALMGRGMMRRGPAFQVDRASSLVRGSRMSARFERVYFASLHISWTRFFNARDRSAFASGGPRAPRGGRTRPLLASPRIQNTASHRSEYSAQTWRCLVFSTVNSIPCAAWPAAMFVKPCCRIVDLPHQRVMVLLTLS